MVNATPWLMELLKVIESTGISAHYLARQLTVLYNV